MSYQSIFDADGQIAAQWPAAAGPPYTYVVDRQGRVAAIFVDSSTTLLQAALNQVAVERPPLHVEVATKRVWFPHGQASLDPPGPGQAPADPTAAWQRIAAALPNTICEGARSMVVQFGLFTNYLVVSTDPLRYKPYDYRNVPEWVVRCTDVPQPPALGPPLSESVRSGQNLPYSLPLVDSISVFDARTGKLLIGFDDTAS